MYLRFLISTRLLKYLCFLYPVELVAAVERNPASFSWLWFTPRAWSNFEVCKVVPSTSFTFYLQGLLVSTELGWNAAVPVYAFLYRSSLGFRLGNPAGFGTYDWYKSVSSRPDILFTLWGTDLSWAETYWDSRKTFALDIFSFCCCLFFKESGECFRSACDPLRLLLDWQALLVSAGIKRDFCYCSSCFWGTEFNYSLWSFAVDERRLGFLLTLLIKAVFGFSMRGEKKVLYWVCLFLYSSPGKSLSLPCCFAKLILFPGF